MLEYCIDIGLNICCRIVQQGWCKYVFYYEFSGNLVIVYDGETAGLISRGLRDLLLYFFDNQVLFIVVIHFLGFMLCVEKVALIQLLVY